MNYDKDTIVFEPIPTHDAFTNLTGRSYERLTVIGYAGKLGKNHRWWCKCVCGNVKAILAYSIQHGNTQSCGCLRIEKGEQFQHGETRNGKISAEYGIYAAAKSRCNNPHHVAYGDYGGRGIEFQFASFEEFLAAVGRRPSNSHSLDRFPNTNGHYVVGNLRWATAVEQSRNKRNNRFLTVSGIVKCMRDWADTVTDYKRIYARIHDGWCDECAVLTKSRGQICPHRTQ